MRTIKKQILLIVFMCFICLNALAQGGLHVESIFNEYGKIEGSIMIELNEDVLSWHTGIKKYKSLSFEADEATESKVLEAYFKDVDLGTCINHSKKDGKHLMMTFCLKKSDDSSQNKYLLYKNKDNVITLIYIRGYFPPRKLEKEMNKLKDLFIKVNNKRLKL